VYAQENIAKNPFLSQVIFLNVIAVQSIKNAMQKSISSISKSCTEYMRDTVVILFRFPQYILNKKWALRNWVKKDRLGENFGSISKYHALIMSRK